VVKTITGCAGAADGREAIRCSQAVSANRSLCSSSRREEAHFKTTNPKPKSKRAFSLRLLQVSWVVAGSTWTCMVAMNPTPIPPARGACLPSHLAGSPPGRGQGVGGFMPDSFFLSDLLAGVGTPTRTRRSAYVVPAFGRQCCVLCRPHAGRALLRFL